MGDQTVGLQARMMSQAMRKLAGNLNRANTLCLFTNQIREKIGVMFGSPETQPGGRALKFYSSQRLDIRRIETLKEGTEAVGNRVRVKVVKNKVAAPFRQAEFDIEYGQGISTAGLHPRPRASSTTSSRSRARSSPTATTRLGQGRNNAKALPAREPGADREEIEQKIYAAVGFGQDGAPIAAVPDGVGPTASILRPARSARRPDGRGAARVRSRLQGAQPARPDGLRAEMSSRGQAGRAGRDRGGRRRAGAGAAARRRPLRAPLRRGQAESRSVGRRADRARAGASWGRRRPDRQRRSRPRTATSELDAAVALLADKVGEPPADDRARDRAWRMLVRKGYAPELAYDAVRAHSAR